MSLWRRWSKDGWWIDDRTSLHKVDLLRQLDTLHVRPFTKVKDCFNSSIFFKMSLAFKMYPFYSSTIRLQVAKRPIAERRDT